MRFNDFPLTTTMAANDEVLVSNATSGARRLRMSNFYEMNDSNGWLHRQTWRGQNLGGVVTGQHLASIRNGSFSGLWLGDYWSIDSTNWRIMDFNYFWGTGDTRFTQYHLVIVPDNVFGTSKYATGATLEPYARSYIRGTGQTEARNKINNLFGSNVLTYRDYLTNSIDSDGAPNGASWQNCTVELMNELMVNGTVIRGWKGGGYNMVYNSVGVNQFSGYRINREARLYHNSSYWLRDNNVRQCSLMSRTGLVDDNLPSASWGVKPFFLLG